MPNTLLGGGTPPAPSGDQEARMERLPNEVDALLVGISDEELEQALARRRGTSDVYQTCMYHHELAPRGKDTTSDKIEELEAQGWVDTPAKFNKPKEESDHAERDGQLHEQGREGGSEADGANPDPEGPVVHDQGKDGLSEAAGIGSGELSTDGPGEQEAEHEVLDDDEADKKAKAERKDNVYAAFAVLIKEADDAKFDANGQPKVEPLNDVLGFSMDDPQRVKTIERNRLWEVYRQRLKEDKAGK